MASRTLLISRRGAHDRVVLLEAGRPIEVHVESHSDRVPTGGVYRGRVVRVLPGMQAAFVEVGLKRTGFLHASELGRTRRLGAVDEDSGGAPERSHERAPVAPIESVLSVGDELLVQVDRAPLGQKGARLTTHVGIPGRYVVYLPTASGVGVSRRIREPAERKRLRAGLLPLLEEGGGVVVRTLARGAPIETLATDLTRQRAVWRDAAERAANAPVPSLVLAAADLVERSMRDLLGPRVRRVEVEGAELVGTVEAFVDAHGVEGCEVVPYAGEAGLLDVHGVRERLRKALRPRVWLPSGGYLCIEETEALVSIDVNSGRFVGKNDLEETVLATNLEAAIAIATQLRLRNLGGLVVIDFIDMERPPHRVQVETALRDALETDRVRTRVLPMSELGLVELTRQRTRAPLSAVMTEACGQCSGLGRVTAARWLADEVLDTLRATAAGGALRMLVAEVEPRVARHLRAEHAGLLRELEAALGVTIQIRESADGGSTPRVHGA